MLISLSLSSLHESLFITKVKMHLQTMTLSTVVLGVMVVVLVFVKKFLINVGGVMVVVLVFVKKFLINVGYSFGLEN